MEPPLYIDVIMARLRFIGISPVFTEDLYISWRGWARLLFSGIPNNLEQLKIYGEKSLKTMKEWYSENGLKMNSNKLNAFFLQHQILTKG